MFQSLFGFYRVLSLAIRSLLLHKLRSLLTVMGLVFGVSSVIIMLAVGEGASEKAQRQIQALGANNIIVRSKKPVQQSTKASSQDDQEGVLIYGLTYDDLERIDETIPTVKMTTPLREFKKKIRYLDREIEGRIVGVTPDYLEMNRLVESEGRFIDDIDLDLRKNICVVGYDAATRLFPYESPVGKSVRVGNKDYYRIVGTTAFRAPSAGTGSSLSAQDFNLDVYIPLTTDRVRFGHLLINDTKGSTTLEQLELSQITVAVNSINAVKATARVLESLLGKYHPESDYSITVPLELLEQARETKRIFNLVLGSTAAISLLVGGIGIMNIMLATVTERTREIGIRRALGARKRDIVWQFLVETGVLSVTGSLIGAIIGLLAPQLVSQFSGMETIITPWSMFAAIGVSLLTGVIFGVYPAIRAAALDPIEALRAE